MVDSSTAAGEESNCTTYNCVWSRSRGVHEFERVYNEGTLYRRLAENAVLNGIIDKSEATERNHFLKFLPSTCMQTRTR
jgi:hypothetical protein